MTHGRTEYPHHQRRADSRHAEHDAQGEHQGSKDDRDLHPDDGRERLLTDKQLGDFLHVSRKTLQIYRKEKLLPYIELKGKCLYRESDIERILRKHYHAAI